MLIGIGCPRSATTYTARLLQALGKAVGAETLDVDGVVGWQWAARPEEYGPTPRVIHQLRDPLKTIPSLIRLRSASWAQCRRDLQRYLRPGQPRLTGEKTLAEAMLLWMQWTKLCMMRTSWCYRIEELPVIYEKWCARCGVRPDHAIRTSIPTTTNARSHPPATWEELYAAHDHRAARVREMAIGLGYREHAAP